MDMVEIDRLTYAFLDGTIGESDSGRLTDLLRANEADVDRFIMLVDLQSALSTLLRQGQAAREVTARSLIARRPVRGRERRDAPPADAMEKRVFPMRWAAPLALAASLLVAAGVWMWSGREGRVSSRLRPEASARHGVKGEVVARVAEKRSEVRGQKSDGRWTELKVGEEVRAGDRIETGKDGAVTLAWVKEPTTVQLDGNSSLDTRHLILLFLERGKLVAVVAKQDPARPFVVETPQAVATVLGTRFSLRVHGSGFTVPGSKQPQIAGQERQNGSTWLDVEEGLVKFMRLADGEAVDVAAGQFAVAGAKAEDYALKTYTKGTEWVEGPIIFCDDFEQASGQWEVLCQGPGDEKYRPASAGERKWVFGTTMVGRARGTVTKSLCVEIPKTETVKVGVQTKDPIMAPAYAMECDVWFRAVGTVFHVILPGCTEARNVSRKEPTIGRGWYRWRVECIPASGPETQGFYDVRQYINAAPYRHDLARFDVRRLTLGVENGSVSIDNVLIRELRLVQSAQKEQSK